MRVVFGLAVVVSAGCSSLPERSIKPWDNVVEQTWSVTRIDGVSVIPGSQITIRFDSDGTMSGQAQNRFHASYKVDGHSITIEPVAATRVHFDEPAGTMLQEGRLFVTLQDVTSWEGRLILMTEDGREIELERAP